MTVDPGCCAEVVPDLPARIAGDTLTYRVPERLWPIAGVGVRALVPLGSRTTQGFVMAVHPCEEKDGRQTREIVDVPDPDPLFSPGLAALARWVAEETLSSLREAVHCLIPPEILRHRPAQPAPRVAVLIPSATLGRRLGPRQTQILEALRAAPGGLPISALAHHGGGAALRRLVALGAARLADDAVRVADPAPHPAEPVSGPDPRFPDERPVLLWGDAEARLSWIVDAAVGAVRRRDQVLIVVPEIALTPGFVERFRAILGDGVAAFHSGLSARRRRDLWRRVRAGEVDVVVGARSAVFAPLPRVRLIVLDEEQDSSFKASSAPRYHGRDVALHRGRLEGARVVLGSGAPSVESYAAAQAGDLMCLRLPRTVPGARVTVVDMRAAPRPMRPGILSQPLLGAIRRHLSAGGRIALFVNRLGYARVLLCQECGFAVRCPRCEVTMSYDRESGSIHCRVCGAAAAAPEVCPRCKGVALRWVGPGTKRVEEVVRRLFPTLRIARVDRETFSSFEAVAREFAAGRTRLVVGTQLLLRARQLHPSLIGVIDADHPLHLPDFRAAERAFQQLRAVVSLAGGPPDPDAVVQTRVPDHPAIVALRTGQDDRLYESELAIRREFGYPPSAHLARLVASSPDRSAARALAEQVAETARGQGVEVLGPALVPGGAPIRGGRQRFHVQCLLRGQSRAEVRRAARAALARAARRRSVRLSVEMDPQEPVG